MGRWILLLALLISLPVFAQSDDGNPSLYVAISHCLQRMAGLPKDLTPQCDALMYWLAPSVDTAANEKVAPPKVDKKSCEQNWMTYDITYEPLRAGRGLRACLTDEEFAQLVRETEPYRR